MADPFLKKPRTYYPRCVVQIALQMETYEDETKTIVFNTEPLDLNIVRNSYNQADSFSMTFDAKDMPISPSIIRGGNVSVRVFDNEGNTAGNSVAIPLGGQLTQPTFSGVIDDVDMNFDKGGQTVTVQGQDYTVLFLEKRYVDSNQKGQGRRRSRRRLINNKRIDEFMEQMIKEADKGVNLKFVNETGITNLPVVGKGSSKTNKRRGYPVKKDSSFWDIMYEVAALHGFIIFVRNTEIVLARPLKVQKGKKRPLYSLTWGNNISSINISRKMGRQKTPRIKCVCYNDESKETLEAVFPQRNQIATTGVGTNYNEIVVKRIFGIKDSIHLKRIAENWYNILARSEQTARVSTMDMLDDGGRSLLDVGTGDLMEIHFSPFNKEHLDNMEGTAQKASFLRSRGLPGRAAGILAQHTELLTSFKRDMYIRSATIQWSISSGFSLDVELINTVSIKKGEEP